MYFPLCNLYYAHCTTKVSFCQGFLCRVFEQVREPPAYAAWILGPDCSGGGWKACGLPFDLTCGGHDRIITGIERDGKERTADEREARTEQTGGMMSRDCTSSPVVQPVER
jgi:hypothetical protein